jgi:thioredoxin-related protein
MKKVKISPKKMMKSNNITKYIMIILLVVIVVFTGIYIVNINKSIIQQEHYINEESEKKFKLVMIYSNSCGYCTKFKPVFQSVSNKFAHMADAEMHEGGTPGASPYMSNVQGVPFMLILKDRQVVATKAGYVDEAQFKAWVNSFIVM